MTETKHVPTTSEAPGSGSGSGPAETPATDDRDPAQLLTAMVDRVLALAATWTAWDGRPVPAGDRLYTPHKAIRRVADHLVDHLAEMEARLVGEETQPDHWHASATTTAADLAPFTGADLDEARSRLHPPGQDLGEPPGRPDPRRARPLGRNGLDLPPTRLPPGRVGLLRGRRGRPDDGRGTRVHPRPAA